MCIFLEQQQNRCHVIYVAINIFEFYTEFSIPLDLLYENFEISLKNVLTQIEVDQFAYTKQFDEIFPYLIFNLI